MEFSSQTLSPGAFGGQFAAAMTKALLRPVQLLAASPPLLFLGALTAMLLRPPDGHFFEIDRIAFGLLIVGVLARAVTQRQAVLVTDRATWPMIGLIGLAVGSAMGQSFDHESWSLLASKFLVPFTLFHLAGLAFADERHFRQFEKFALLVLAYLSFTAIAFLTGAHSLIFPRFILDASVGFHADRARGPLLQAVANGVSLNVLGLLALHAYRRGSLRGAKVVTVLASVPIAILATMTRTVWFSFAGSVLALILLSKSRALRRACMGVLIVAGLGLAVVLSHDHVAAAIGERLEERGPIEYREAVYTGGWEMFLQRPLLGWGFHEMPSELPRHVSGYPQKVLYPHNTYLELAVESGLVGLAFYLWLMWEMLRLARGPVPVEERDGFLDSHFHRLWPVLLGVYWINAATVVMSYQFVNGLFFTMAGMLAAQRRRWEHAQAC
jgi:putative inorganic carbon (hco3(-)) transporter